MAETHTENPKKHCMVVHAYYPFSETRVQREALALTRNGFEVDVICLRNEGTPAQDSEDGIGIHRLPVRRHKGSGILVQFLEYIAFMLLTSIKLTQLHMQKQFGTVQVHNLPDFLVFSALIPKLFGAKIILDLHDLMPEFYAAKFDGDMDSLLARLIIWQERISCWFADHVIAVTEVWKQTLIERGVPADKISVVMNVADASVFNRAMAAEQPEKPDNKFNLFYHGTLTQRYGIDLIIEAVNQLKDEIPEIHLTIIGSGETLKELQQMVETLNLHDYVDIFPSRFHVVELAERICQAHAGIVPNRNDVFTDGILPTKMMEYVALGVPVIAARTSMISAYFDDTMAQFFEPGDSQDLARAILALYNDREKLAQISESSKRFNQQYNWEDIAASYANTVAKLASS